ncbi:hypothetical protein L596_000177 [Steinernema carpocapsae]|uniref:Uncharacterized protein n=1 Tax=Steinernema carpocapsae TaxID=34508 RepID=A0A4U8UHA9_STECR|nr:hypothetical protein L596_000177 [Steinernema carpocapsae]
MANVYPRYTSAFFASSLRQSFVWSFCVLGYLLLEKHVLKWFDIQHKDRGLVRLCVTVVSSVSFVKGPRIESPLSCFLGLR